MTKNKYRCGKCGFEHRFDTGTFKNIDKAAARELRKCPGCGVRMEVGK